MSTSSLGLELASNILVKPVICIGLTYAAGLARPTSPSKTGFPGTISDKFTPPTSSISTQGIYQTGCRTHPCLNSSLATGAGNLHAMEPVAPVDRKSTTCSADDANSSSSQLLPALHTTGVSPILLAPRFPLDHLIDARLPSGPPFLRASTSATPCTSEMDLAGSLSTLPSIDSMVSLLAESHADIDLARLSAPNGQQLEQLDMPSVPMFTPTETLISTVDRDTRSNSHPIPPPPKTHRTASANSKTILGSIPTVFSFTPSLESQQETPKNEADAEGPFVVVRRSSKRKVNALIKVYRRVMKPYHVRKAKRMAWKIVEAAEKAAVCNTDGAGKDAAYTKAKHPTKLGLGLVL